MPYSYDVQRLAVQDPQNLLRVWHKERSLRVASTLCYAGLALSLVGTIADYFWSDLAVFITDILLVLGCLLSIYWLRRPQRPTYYWWPMLWTFWISCLPSLWLTGGLTSPFFAVDIAAFYTLSSVLDEKDHSIFYMWFALLHIPVFYAIEFVHPLAHTDIMPLELTAIITAITFGAIIICMRAMLKTERGIALDFAEHLRNMQNTEKALMKSDAQLRDAHNDLEQRVRDRTMELAKSLAREKEAKAIAEHASQAKMQFLANMSHEIRTPMNSILGFAELLSQGEQSPEEAQDYIRRIRTNGAQLLHLIDDILDLSKFEAGQIPIHKVTFNLKSAIDDVIHSFLPTLENRGLKLELNYHGTCFGQYISDAHRIQQVLINLLSNSIKFSDGGDITVDVYCEPIHDDNKLLFSIDVRDNGIGISQENQKKLFQPFSQGDSSVARRFGGTGLGLAISRRICEALGGSLELVHSSINEGSHFHFKIPLEPVQKENLGKEEVKSTPQHHHDSFGLKGKHILLAEDAKDNAILICHYLRAIGIHIDVASDGLQAVNMAKQTDYDCILMDIQMPGMDGLEATRILRSQGYDKPIIALTAHALASEMDRSLEAGCTQHLTKPIKRADLIDALNNHVRSSSEASKSPAP